jgi:nucleoside-diphosphate-sugar epimerase
MPELLIRIARYLDTAPRMFSFPPGLLRLGLKAIGRGGMAAALIGSLSIDDNATRTRLNWKPRVSFDDGLAATCRDFRKAAP